MYPLTDCSRNSYRPPGVSPAATQLDPVTGILGLPAQRQGRQLQPGGPPLGAGGQGRQRRFRQGHVRDGRPLPQQSRRNYLGPWGDKVDARMHLDAWRRVLDKEEPDYAT